MSLFSTTRHSTVLILIGFLFFASIYVVRVQEDMADFDVNYRAGERLRSGEALYRIQDGHFMFKYPPFSALLYVPLTFLPLEAAKVVWYAALVCCSIAIFYASSRMVTGESAGGTALYLFPPLILAKFFFGR